MPPVEEIVTPRELGPLALRGGVLGVCQGDAAVQHRTCSRPRLLIAAYKLTPVLGGAVLPVLAHPCHGGHGAVLSRGLGCPGR